MTLSRREQSKRAVEKAAREVAARENLYNEIEVGANIEPPREPSELEIVEVVEEHIGWDLDDIERGWAMAAYKAARDV